jgi:hypothetical protein
MRSILAGICLLGFSLPSLAAPVTPNFTSGTVTSHTESTTTVNEIIRQQDFQTGFTYTASGTNINVPGTPSLGTEYYIVNQGQPFQFTETYMGPGLIKDTTVNRTTTIQSVTDSMSVFTQ